MNKSQLQFNAQKRLKHKIKWNLFLVSILIFFSCTPKQQTKDVLFTVLDSEKTGLDFSNNLSFTQQFNLFKYIYFYNGSGVGAGDFNNDGLVDLFFGSNQGQNKIYLNKGNLKFHDVTAEAHIPHDTAWTTGISVADINNDGLLDIYICRVGNFETLKSKNQLLICVGIDKNGVPVYEDKAHDYGLDFSGFSTQAVFFDYDMDGDLDMFLLNHSVHQNGTFKPRKEFEGTFHPTSGDRMFRNDGTTFTDVTAQVGIHSTAIGYGLGISVADINMDGYPDIYVGNDFHENDYLYINHKNGKFTEENNQHLMHTSQYTMGVDIADANNDGFPEIISMDMLPSDPYILKRSLGEDDYNTFLNKISYGYNYQYTRNNLQFNRKNGMFSEVGLYSGVAATDWSWSPLWMDFDNDGLKDLFISNGIPKRMNDIDYINFVTDGKMQEKIINNKVEGTDISLINKFPEIKVENKFFSNEGDLSFEDETMHIEGNAPTFSNGAIYADLDNDGDLDIVVNNIDAAPLLYENKVNDKGKHPSLKIVLSGSSANINAIGAKVLVFANDQIRTYEKVAVRGFMSSMETPLLIGTGKSKIDSIIIVWPDNTFEHIPASVTNHSIKAQYRKGLPVFNYATISEHSKNNTRKAEDMTRSVNLNYMHHENYFNEFDREVLIPHMISTEGPALCVADINHDGLDDVFIGSSRNHKSAIFLQRPGGKFIKTLQSVIDNDSSYEDVAATWADVNNDGNIDLIVASGGNEFYGPDVHNTPRVYLNNGKAEFTLLNNAFQNMYLTASCIVAYDFNGDGFVDLFIGGRAVPYAYGALPRSYLLLNDKTGRYKDVTEQYAGELFTPGFVTQGLWFDIDKDGDKDLLLCYEWGGIDAFINNKGYFTKKILTAKKGWWNFLLPCDVDKDGDVDLIAGNLGYNSRLHASENEPVRLYYNDFDDNGRKEQVLTYYVDGKEIPFANKAELDKQIPLLKKRYLYAADFAKATLSDLFTQAKLDQSSVLSANYFSSAILINKGNLNFEVKALPWQAQLAPLKCGVVVNINNDSLPDIMLMGNYYENNIEMGRYDADMGTLLVNHGKGNFSFELLNGLFVRGQVRNMQPITIAKDTAYILARNNDSTFVLKFSNKK